jgi:O-antigen/teichoic acid export membrane protein
MSEIILANNSRQFSAILPRDNTVSPELLSANEVSGKTSAGLSLRASFSWTFLANALYAGTQWGLLVLLTKLFEPELFGRYALALSIVTPTFTASAMSLRAVQISSVEDEVSFTDYLFLRMTTNLLALLFLVLVVSLGSIPSKLLSLMLLLGCNQAVDLVRDLYQGVMQKRERMDLVSISKVLGGCASIAMAAVMAFLTHNILFVVAGMVTARFSALLLYDIPRSRALEADCEPLVTWPGIRRALRLWPLLPLARTAFPLTIVTLFISLFPNIPRYFLAGSGEAAVGYFAAIASLVSLQELVTGALGEAAIRRLALDCATDRTAYVRLTGRLMGIFVALGMVGVVIAMAFGGTVLTILFRPEYARFANVLVWLMVAKVAVNAQSSISYAMTAARMFKVQVCICGLMLVSMVFFAWLLIPTWSLLGAAWATLISACVCLTISLVVMMKKLSFRVGVSHG